RVTIFGAGFDPIAAANVVSFTGASGAIESATSTQLVVVVPTGATTGPITVEATAGTATSASAFGILATDGVPTITGFNPAVGAAGSAFTIAGTNFAPVVVNDR